MLALKLCHYLHSISSFPAITLGLAVDKQSSKHVNERKGVSWPFQSLFLSWPTWSWTISFGATTHKVHVAETSKNKTAKKCFAIIKSRCCFSHTHTPLHSVIHIKPGTPAIGIYGQPKHTRMDKQFLLAASNHEQDLTYKITSD